ncbi:uncharacterized protein LOC126267522 isoform X2 [Schistocerca gregaria]|uniref:uncharacterized protein LOC126267522 isoform X2 n=1 Tax=Schistocerca gregaria TaxID=7010 RepID=UPI00211E42A3|nr:uncharacterized protein LOC126267522 isoform X2 [Schistocerca gregaria]
MSWPSFEASISIGQAGNIISDMWGDDTQVQKGPITFSLMRKRQSRAAVELRAYRPLGDMSARHAETAWLVLRGYLDSLLCEEKLTAVPKLPLATDAAAESNDAGVDAGFNVGSVFVKTSQTGGRGRRRRTYQEIGNIADVLDEAYTDVPWCDAAARPAPLPVERPVTVEVVVRDPGTGRDSLCLLLRDLSLRCLTVPGRGLLSFKKAALRGASTVYLVTRTLAAAEVEMRISIRDRERVLYQGTPTPVGIKYRKIRLDRRGRLMHPRNTVVSMRYATWVPKGVAREEESEEKEQPTEVPAEREQEVKDATTREVDLTASRQGQEVLTEKSATVVSETGSAGEPKPLAILTPL